jgi:hypothetical protein
MAEMNSIAETFWAEVGKAEPSACWPWLGTSRTKGYGVTWVGALNRKYRAHRLAWELTNGPVPGGLNVCHRCDNRLCCNPDHLFLGDTRANNHDTISKGRNTFGSRNGQAKLTEAKVAEIKARLRAGEIPPGIAPDYGVTPETIRHIRGGKHWGHGS